MAQQAQALTCCACLKLSPVPRPHSGRNNSSKWLSDIYICVHVHTHARVSYRHKIQNIIKFSMKNKWISKCKKH